MEGFSGSEGTQLFFQNLVTEFCMSVAPGFDQPVYITWYHLFCHPSFETPELGPLASAQIITSLTPFFRHICTISLAKARLDTESIEVSSLVVVRHIIHQLCRLWLYP
jgi:hypothetical protein